jgi:hypothetical protein
LSPHNRTPQERVNEAARLLGLNVEATNGGVSYTDALSVVILKLAEMSSEQKAKPYERFNPDHGHRLW